jgi:hypothetical protein
MARLKDCGPSGWICHYITRSFSTFTAGTSNEKHLTSIPGVLEHADDGKGLPCVKATGRGHILVDFTFHRVNISNVFALGLIVERELEVEVWIKH